MRKATRLAITLFLSISLFVSYSGFAQNGIIRKAFIGGSGQDGFVRTIELPNREYISIGVTNSSDRDIVGHHGKDDVLIVKYDSLFRKVWTRVLGGGGDDYLSYIRPLSDGSFILAGTSELSGGDVPLIRGDFDGWMIKISASGNIIWNKTYGGSGIDILNSLVETTNGDLIVSGYTNSTDMQLEGRPVGRSSDFWVFRTDKDGNILKSKIFGGSNEDSDIAIQTSLLGYVLAGNTTSSDGDVPADNPQYNKAIWIAEIDDSLQLMRKKILNTEPTEGITWLEMTPNGRLFISTEKLYRLDANWNVVWSHTPIQAEFGYTQLRGMSIHPEGGLVLFGQHIGDKLNYARRDSLANYDGFIERVTDQGQQTWLKFWGGSASDGVNHAFINSKGNYILSVSAGDSSCDNIGAKYTVSELFNSEDAAIVEWAQPNVINGKVFFDANGNRRYDRLIDKEVTDLGLLGKLKLVTTDGLFNWIIEDVTGSFQVLLDSGTYALNLAFERTEDSLKFSQYPRPFTLKLTGAKKSDSIFIALGAPNAIVDIIPELKLISSGAIGTKAKYSIGVNNVGGMAYDSARIAVAIPAGSVFLHSTRSPLYVTRDTIYWMFRDISASSTDSIIFQLQLPSTPVAKIGDSVRLFALLTPYGPPDDISNNFVTRHHVLASQVQSIASLTLELIPQSQPMPSGLAAYQLRYRYEGEIDSVVADLAFATGLSLPFKSATPQIDGAVKDSLFWNGRLLINGKSDSINIQLTVPPTPVTAFGADLKQYASLRPLLIQNGPAFKVQQRLDQKLGINYNFTDIGPVADEQGIDWLGTMDDDSVVVSANQVSSCVQPNSDVALATQGYMKSDGSNGILLQMISENGIVKWRKLYKDAEVSNVIAVSSSNGKLGVLVNKFSYHPLWPYTWAQLILFDSLGNKLWEKDLVKVIGNFGQTYNTILRELAVLPNGNFLISGMLDYPFNSGLNKGVIIECPLDNAPPVSTLFSVPKVHVSFGNMVFNSQGELFLTARLDTIVGISQEKAKTIMTSVIKVDLPTATISWIKTFPEVDIAPGFIDILLSGDTLTAVGSGTFGAIAQGYLKQLRTDGTPIADRSYQLSAGLSISSITKDKDGLVLLGSLERIMAYLYIPALLRTDMQGNPRSLKVLKPVRVTPSSANVFEQVLSLNDGSLLVSGFGLATSVNGFKVSLPKNRFQYIKLNTSNYLNGFVYYDENNNGLFDTGEVPVDDVSVVARVNGTSSLTTSPVNGKFRLSLDPGTSVVKVVSQSGMLASRPDSSTILMGPGMQRDTLTIRMVKFKDSADLQVELLPMNTARPGFESQYTLSYTNRGSKAASNVKLYFVRDRRQQLVSATTLPSNTTGDTLRWDIGTLGSQKSGNIGLVFRNAPPPGMNNGDSLRLFASVEPKIGDGFPSNNQTVLNQSVKGSFDPNDKTEINNGTFTPEQMTNKESLVYLIRFQNTGNDTAFRVYVMDTLDTKLNLNTIEVLSYSHPVRWSVTGKGIVQWNFDPIQLPDSSTNEKASHGYVSFRIQPNQEVKVGDIIPNRAAIYFDFNPPVLTNTVLTTFRTNIVTSVRNPLEQLITIKAFPNPAISQVTVELKGKVRGNLDLKLVDMTGKTVMQKKVGLVFADQWRSTLSMAGLAPGMYTLLVQIDGDSVPFRIIKQ